MSVVVVKDGRVAIPGELLRQIGLGEGDPVVVEATESRTLQVRPATNRDAEAELLRLLEEPFDLGVIEPLTREAIYDAAD